MFLMRYTIVQLKNVIILLQKYLVAGVSRATLCARPQANQYKLLKHTNNIYQDDLSVNLQTNLEAH